MAIIVDNAFRDFLRDYVNLEPEDTAQARSSRDWLVNQIHLLPEKHDGFPTLYSDVDIHYGSFARRTKTRELDDLDMIIGISALGTTYSDFDGIVYLSVPDGIALRNLCHNENNLLNSRRVINKFVSHLQDVPQYSSSDINRNQMAAVLNLKSYPWSFDIVPGFFTSPEIDGRTYYIIPNGDGHWMKTDPRVDKRRIESINQKHNGNVLNIIRLIKYWNRRPTMPTISSYLLECILLRCYESVEDTVSSYVDIEVSRALIYLANNVWGAVQDPKGIQGDINTLSWDEQRNISTRAMADADKAVKALAAEANGDYAASIGLWREIFGSAFS
jgi:hypothetical protein